MGIFYYAVRSTLRPRRHYRSRRNDKPTTPTEAAWLGVLSAAVILGIMFLDHLDAQVRQPIGWVITDNQDTPIYPGQPVTDPTHFWPNASYHATATVPIPDTATNPILLAGVLVGAAIVIGFIIWLDRKLSKPERDAAATATAGYAARAAAQRIPTIRKGPDDDPPHGQAWWSDRR